MSQYTLGVDTGGTFTDLVIRDQSGRCAVHKLLSTPNDPSLAIVEGVKHLLPKQHHHALSIVHGTTVATNALLERKGARIALFTNEGLEDVLFLRRQHRPQLYRFVQNMPQPILSPELCFGVPGRLNARGEEVDPIALDHLSSIVHLLKDVDAIAIALLHAYINPVHEQALKLALRSLVPDTFICTSTEVSAEFREYERTSTTCVNAYLGPVMEAYLNQLQGNLCVASLDVFQSDGTRADVGFVAQYPVRTALSGPAGGVMGAVAVAKQLGQENIITFDMGGTSTDVSLYMGDLALGRGVNVGGLDIQVPMLDIHTVGAGGGSLAKLDQGMVLRVGPDSAGAVPGPASYGRGGTQPTVTDAHVVLGRLRAGRFLGASMTLASDAARKSLECLAREMDMTLDEVAFGILDVADAAMIRALKVISVERGHDPRACALVAFGGAGGLHACRLANALEIRRVIVPGHPGVLSAFGMMHAPRARFFGQSRIVAFDLLDERVIISDMAHLSAQASKVLGEDVCLHWSVDLRYVGQSFTLTVDVKTQKICKQTLVDAFHKKHQHEYGWSSHARALEWVTLRLYAFCEGYEVGTVPDTESAQESPVSDTIGFGGTRHEAWIRQRHTLSASVTYEGPGVVTEYSATTLVPPGWSCRLEGGHMILEVMA